MMPALPVKSFGVLWLGLMLAVLCARAVESPPAKPAPIPVILEHMKSSEKTKLITINLAVWVVAMFTHPLAQMLPTG